MSEFTDIIGKSLPYIAAAASGNIPALVGMAAKAVGDAIGVKVDPTPEAINKAVAGATPEQMIALKQSEQQFALEMQKLGFQNAKDMRTLDIQETQAFISDTQDARKSFSQDKNVFDLGVVILCTFAATTGMALWGCYGLLTNGIQIKDAGIVAAVFTFLGSIIGYLGANAQQVVGYFFGTSSGSKQKTDLLADAITNLGKK